MLNQGYFYWQTTRSLIAGFGQIFNDIVVTRFSNNGNRGSVVTTIPVPISYAPIDKILLQLQQKVEPQGKTRTKISLPRMAYRITNYQYDAERKINSLNQNYSNTSNTQVFLQQLSPVPYDISFELAIMAKNNADALQIIEQILPSFCPSYTLNMEAIPELNITRTIPVEFAGITQDDSFEGIMEENRVIIWRLQFVCKAYLFPVVRDQGLIKKVIATLYPNQTLTDPSTAVITVDVEQDSHGQDVLDSNGDPVITTTVTETDS